VPDGAAVLKLDQRVEQIGAISARAQLLPADARQVQDGHGAGRWRQVGQRPVDDALEPDDRPGALRRGVLAQDIQVRASLLKGR